MKYKERKTRAYLCCSTAEVLWEEVLCASKWCESLVALESREDPPPGVEREWMPLGQRTDRRQPADPEDSSAH